MGNHRCGTNCYCDLCGEHLLEDDNVHVVTSMPFSCNSVNATESAKICISCLNTFAAAPEMKAALEAIAGMKRDADTNYEKLAAICVAIARIALAKAEGK